MKKIFAIMMSLVFLTTLLLVGCEVAEDLDNDNELGGYETESIGTQELNSFATNPNSNPPNVISQIYSSHQQHPPTSNFVGNEVIIEVAISEGGILEIIDEYQSGRRPDRLSDIGIGAISIRRIGSGQTAGGRGVAIFVVTLDRYCKDNVMRVIRILNARNDILEAGPNLIFSHGMSSEWS